MDCPAVSIGIRVIIYGGFALSFSGLVVSVLDMIGGGLNALIWLTIALYAVFSVLFECNFYQKEVSKVSIILMGNHGPLSM